VTYCYSYWRTRINTRIPYSYTCEFVFVRFVCLNPVRTMCVSMCTITVHTMFTITCDPLGTSSAFQRPCIVVILYTNPLLCPLCATTTAGASASRDDRLSRLEAVVLCDRMDSNLPRAEATARLPLPHVVNELLESVALRVQPRAVIPLQPTMS
jgi:hypothetical protein